MNSAPHSILIVEDEPTIADTIVYALKTEGFNPRHVTTGAEAIAALESDPDIGLAILDIGLPDTTGFELFKRIREIRPALPTLFLTARSEEIDRILGLELGADDYITKPFSPRELSARVRNIMKRARPQAPTPVAAAKGASPFTVDSSRLRISFRGQELELSRYEFKLLKVLVEHPGRVYSRDQLMDLVWDEPDSSMDRTVDAHIKQLRAKLRLITPDDDVIITHRGFGYSLRERW